MSWLSRLKNALRSAALDRELQDEIQDHLERRAAALRNEGLNAAEAHRQARVAFGGISRIREESREIRLSSGLETTLQDVRYAWRGLRRSPTFTITALASLGLAIGAITAIHAVIDAAMLRPLPLPKPEQLFTLSAATPPELSNPARSDIDVFSFPTYAQLREATNGIARLAVVSPAERVEAQMPNRAAPFEKVVQQFVSGETFETLGVRPALGQLFSSADDRGRGTERVAVISFAYWHRHYDSRTTLLNRSILVNGGSYRIIGVTAEGFFGVEPGRFVDVWLPVMTFDPGVFTNPAARAFRIIGRLSAGVSRQQVQARLGDTDIRVNEGAVGLAGFRRSFGASLAIITVVGATILLIAVANVASLLMGRATARSGEMALRRSLGAGRSRLVRQLLTESALLSTLAGALGWMLATVFAPWLIMLLSKSNDPFQFVLSMNTRTLWFCIALCAACTLSFGLIPALNATSAMLTLRRFARQTSTFGLSRLFVGLQMAFAFCLVIAAAGFLFSLYQLFRVNTGFDAEQVTVLTLRSDIGPQQPGLRMTQQLQGQIAMLPTVHSAAVAWRAIFDGRGRMEAVVVPGRPRSDRQEVFYRVSPGYFATLGTPLLRGRDLGVNDSDAQQPIPTVINQTFARTYFGESGALGREFQRVDGARHVVIGIAADSYYDDLRHGPQGIAYFPMKPPRFFTLYVRSSLDPGSVMALVEREASILTPGLHVVDVTTLKALIGNTLVTERLLAHLGGLFAAIGLLLAAVGAFGVMNYTVLRRTKELGIRAALGARSANLVSLVVKDFLGIVLAALVAGFVGSIIVMSLVRTQLFGMRSVEPLVVLVALFAFLGVTATALLVPVLRAAAVDPMIAVRHE